MRQRSYAGRRRLHRTSLFICLACIIAAVGGRSGPSAAAPPADFEDTLVTSVGLPTALAFTPDGHLLITTQPGVLRVYQDGTLLAQPALDLTAVTCGNGERGLLGIAVDPNFATNRFIYLYYTFTKNGTCPTFSDVVVNRVSRFGLSDGNVIAPASERVLVDNIPSPAGNHNGGDLHFGRDGHLYISVGDGGCDYAGDSGCAGANDAARDQHVLLGKILRITSTGEVPFDNPFRGPDSARCNTTGRTDPGKKCQETFASGLRNPFRFAFRPRSNQFYINDVGQGAWEEIDAGLSGADYGWNLREGPCVTGSVTDCGPPPPGLTNPIFAYGGDTGRRSITGGAFVPFGIWPAKYDNAYLFGDFVLGTIFLLVPTEAGFTADPFVDGLGGGSAVTLIFGPLGASQALYYTTYFGEDGGQVRRIAYTGALEPRFQTRLPLIFR